jgi:hypothetical protein
MKIPEGMRVKSNFFAIGTSPLTSKFCNQLMVIMMIMIMMMKIMTMIPATTIKCHTIFSDSMCPSTYYYNDNDDGSNVNDYDDT